MRRKVAITGLVVALAATTSCNLVAGLGDFQAPTGSTTGAGGATSTTKASSTGSKVESTGESATSTKASATSSTGAGNCASHLLINEVDLQDDWVELYNPTSSSIDLGTYTLKAEGTGMALVVKWTGPPPATIGPNAYVQLGATGDGQFTSQISKNVDPLVVVLYDGSNVVDSVCVCGGSCQPDAADVVFCASPVQSPDLFDQGQDKSVGRTSCNDTDDDAADFAEQCPTPKAANMACSGG